MKRDMELMRGILLALEALPENEYIPNPFMVEGHTANKVAHHVHLMGEAGLLEVADCTYFSDAVPKAMPLHITWKGHEFIDTVRSQEVWSKTKEALKDAGGGSLAFMLEFGKTVAEGYVKKKLKDTTGIELG